MGCNKYFFCCLGSKYGVVALSANLPWEKPAGKSKQPSFCCGEKALEVGAVVGMEVIRAKSFLFRNMKPGVEDGEGRSRSSRLLCLDIPSEG